MFTIGLKNSRHKTFSWNPPRTIRSEINLEIRLVLHINRMIYFHGKNCSDCKKAAKNFETQNPEKLYNHLPVIKFVKEKD